VTAESRGPDVPFREAVRAFARVGLQSFGGPAAQIAVLHRVVVEEKRWIGEQRFLHALNFCMLLPGPEAMQLATYVGWMLHGIRGGLVAGALFVLPGAACMLAISALYAVFRDVPAVDALFFGVKAAVLAIVAEAVVRVGRKALRGRTAVVVAVLSFVALWAFRAPFPAVVGGAALVGLLIPRAFGDGGRAPPAPGPRPSWGRFAATAAIGLALWWAPVAALLVVAPDGVHAEQSLFFSKVAVVTFGGAYAVLGYVQQQAVERFAWVTPGQMLDGLGLAETTPGPLILVLQFVAFLGAYGRPGDLPPLGAGALAAAAMLWTTFVPCFLWIFAFAPWVEAVRGVRALSSALAAITAGVVGVIASLGVTLAVHTLFRRVDRPGPGPVRIEAPEWASLDPASAVLAVAAAVLLFGLRWGLGRTLAACAAAGFAWKLVCS
jgi:chromate transporter